MYFIDPVPGPWMLPATPIMPMPMEPEMETEMEDDREEGEDE